MRGAEENLYRITGPAHQTVRSLLSGAELRRGSHHAPGYVLRCGLFILSLLQFLSLSLILQFSVREIFEEIMIYEGIMISIFLNSFKNRSAKSSFKKKRLCFGLPLLFIGCFCGLINNLLF